MTCPQCRRICNQASIHPIFFNVDTEFGQEIEELSQSVAILSSSLPEVVEEKVELVLVRQIENGELNKCLKSMQLSFKNELDLVKYVYIN